MSRLLKLTQSNSPLCNIGSKSALCPECCWFGGYVEDDICTFAIHTGIKHGIAVFRIVRKHL